MDSTPDARLVEMAQSGDQNAFAALYDRYFEQVYDFLARMTGTREDAEAAVRDTFTSAMLALGGLHDGSGFRAWLFTIGHHAALRSLEPATAGTTGPGAQRRGLAGAPAAVDDSRLAGSESPAAARAAAPLICEATGALDPRQVSLLDLHLRQGLDADEIASVLGVSKANGLVALNRLTAAVDDSLRAFILQRTARPLCPGLDQVLAALAPNGAAELREVRPAVDKHVESCPECAERRRGLAPLAVFGAIATTPPPPGLKAEMLAGLLSGWPGRAAGASQGGSGSVPPRLPVASGGRFHDVPGFLSIGAALGAAAGVLALLLLLPSSPLSLTRHDGRQTVVAAAGADGGGPAGGVVPPTSTATRTPAPTSTMAGAGIQTPTPSGTRETQVAATATPSATSTSTATATNTASPTATSVPGTPTGTATKPACNPSLGTFSGPLNVPSGGSTTFVLTNLQFLCGPATYAMTPGAAWLSVSPASGTIGPGQSATISVVVDDSKVPASEGAYSAALSVAGPAGQAFDIQVITARGGQAPVMTFISEVCGKANSTFQVRVGVTDDIGVIAVGVRHTDTDGQQVTVALGLVSGTVANGTWEVNATLVAPTGVASYIVQATDGAGRTASISRACP